MASMGYAVPSLARRRMGHRSDENDEPEGDRTMAAGGARGGEGTSGGGVERAL